MDNHPIDQKIRSHFEQKQINPSIQAWDRLDAMLTVKSKEVKHWYTNIGLVAASAAIILTAGFLFYRNEPLQYVTMSESKNNETAKVLVDNISSQNSDKSTSAIAKIYSNYIKSNTQVRHLLDDKINKINLKTTSPQVKENISLNGFSGIEKMEDVAVEDNINLQNLKKSEKTFQVTPIKRNKLNIKADELLKTAESEIVSNANERLKLKVRNKYGIESNQLLKEAEEKASQTFITKMWSSVQEKSETLITAVADRNQVK